MTQVDVKDFGPISHASVELKPLTIFIGPNSSGKSYLALAIYSLSRTLSGESSFGRIRRGWPYGLLTPRIRREAKVQIAKAWPNARSFPREPIMFRDLPDSLQLLLREAIRAIADSFSSQFGKELTRCYGTEVGSLVRRGPALSAPQLEIGISQSDSAFAWHMQAQDGSIITTQWDSNFADQVIDFGTGGLPLRAFVEEPEYLLMSIASDLGFLNSNQLIKRAHYMPASRSGILLGHKTLAGLIVGQASRAWLEPIEIPRLPGVITDLIQAILLLEHIGPPDAKLQKVVSFLESRVTQGIVDMDHRVEYPEVYYENDSGRFSLHQVSSMVSEIAPIILYLKHLVRRGHLFIIEEPESHIDAENQTRLARAIAMLVNAGVEVLLTTHSDYFVNQINNLLLLSQVTPKRRAARRYSASEVLEPSTVGA